MATEHQVRERAYHIWEHEGRLSGRAQANWIQAEAELRTQAAPLLVEAVDAVRAPSPAKTLKTPAQAAAKTDKAAGKVSRPTKDATAASVVPAKAKRASRKAEHAALH